MHGRSCYLTNWPGVPRHTMDTTSPFRALSWGLNAPFAIKRAKSRHAIAVIGAAMRLTLAYRDTPVDAIGTCWGSRRMCNGSTVMAGHKRAPLWHTRYNDIDLSLPMDFCSAATTAAWQAEVRWHCRWGLWQGYDGLCQRHFIAMGNTNNVHRYNSCAQFIAVIGVAVLANWQTHAVPGHIYKTTFDSPCAGVRSVHINRQSVSGSPVLDRCQTCIQWVCLVVFLC